MTGPLRLRDFRYLFAARAISYVGTYLAPIAVAFAILDNGGGATAVGLGFAAWTLAQVATLAVGGVVGDRVPRRLVMIGSDVASTAVRTTMGLLLVSGHAQVWQLIVLQALGGAAVAFYSPASYGLVREVVPEEQLQQANGLLAIARYAAFPIGGAIGGSIVVLVGTGSALLVDAGTYATSAILLSRIHVKSIARAGAGFLQELREGWSAFVEQTWVWVLVLYVSLYFLITYAPFFVLGPYIAKHSMDGARSWTPVIIGEGIGALLGGLAGLRWRPREPMVKTGLLLMFSAAQNLIL
ncbi:MAG TPA: MFS transporter, partial [Gaiellaceae bacterium]|nr:MFS transporter [Gaiellaceae bacterium]